MVVFLNGRFLPADQAMISVQDRGFLYGDGLFETLRVQGGRPLWLKQHLARLSASAAALRLPLPTDFPWDETIQTLVRRNGLAQGMAAVKILLTRGEVAMLGLPTAAQPTLLISARPYTPPPAADYQQGWPVVCFPEKRAIFLGQHKSLNYLFCLAARQYALDHGCREALLLEADGTVGEAAAAGLLWQEGEAYLVPAAASSLPSVTLTVLAELLQKHGRELQRQKASVSRLLRATGVWLANSLMGLLPVAAIDGQPVALSPTTPWLNDLLWSEAG